ncbi:MAG: hypothetical protein LAT54_05315 [Cryomorphaceae bacterium]|nr:hypothetical protein [Cryomorphaceae bacterium]
MISNHLFPKQYRMIGWMLFVPGIILGIWSLFFDSHPFFDRQVFAVIAEKNLNSYVYFSWKENNILDEIAAVLIIIGGMLAAFSKLPNEDELISQLRLDSLLWATYLNYFILLLSVMFVYEFAFFPIIVFNMFTILIFFLLRFHWVLFRNRLQNDE